MLGARSLPPTIDLDALGFDEGAHVLVARALASLRPGDRLTVSGRHPALATHLEAWCRGQGHRVEADVDGALQVVKGTADRYGEGRAERAGAPELAGIAGRATAGWGLAARGALVELGGNPAGFDLDERPGIWGEAAPRLYAQAVAAQWDPNTAIDWTAPDLPPEVEAAVVQVMTYLIENEQAALAVPARFLGRIHPHYREVVQLLAIQVADEARHIEVFTRRATLTGGPLGVSGVGGRESLNTLLHERRFGPAMLLLSVLGEGTFLNLLAFLERHAPDAVTAAVTRLARQDEARHVAFAMSHLEYEQAADPELQAALRRAIERRHEVLLTTGGLSTEVYDALIVLAAGAWRPEAIAAGFRAVTALMAEMAEGRERRLARLGFPSSDAHALAQLHTRNFM